MVTMASWNTRQFNVNAVVSQQHADITEDQYLEQRRPRKITFYRNGDKFFAGKKVCITPHRYLTFNDLLSDLTKSISLPYGVRRIYTPDHGTPIYDIDDLQDGHAYVCASFEGFKKLRYGKVHRPGWHPSLNRRKLTTDNYLYGGYTAFGPKYRGPLSYSYPVHGKFAAAYGYRSGPSTFGIGHTGPGSFTYTGGRQGIGAIESRPTANIHSDTSPVKPRIVRVVKGSDERPRKVVSLLMNKRSVQSFEQLVSDISEALGVPKYKNQRIRKLFTLKGRELKGVADFFREDDIFIALPSKEHLTDEDLQDIIEELYPENPYAKKLRRKKKERDERDKHDSGFGDDDEKQRKSRRKKTDDEEKKKREDEERKRREDELRKRREDELAAKEAELRRKEAELKRREEEEKKRREKTKQDEIARREAELRKKEAEMRKREEEERKKREKKPLPPPPKHHNKYAAEPKKKKVPTATLR